jgi:hypothetical protein
MTREERGRLALAARDGALHRARPTGGFFDSDRDVDMGCEFDDLAKAQRVRRQARSG